MLENPFIQPTYTTASNNEGLVVQMNVFPPFEKFQKIPRLFRDCVVTEKIDGTNANITITEDGQIRAGGRNRYLYPNKPKQEGKKAEVTDNFGFAFWVEEHKTELLKLGKGRHYGEWYGKGVNRGYGLEEKRFVLFNTSVDRTTLPNCVSVVPVLYDGVFSLDAIRGCIESLRLNGSVAVPGFLRPEGIVVFHKAAGRLFKATLESDEKPKGVTDEA
jgi:hypothetical protein